MSGFWSSAIAALAGFGATALVMFIYNLASAPFRIERDKVLELAPRLAVAEQEIAELKERPRFQLAIDSFISSGVPQPTSPKYMMVVIVQISNIGRVRSALHSWHIAIKTADDQIIPLERWHHPDLKIQTTQGQVMTFLEADAIYNKTAKPVEEGEIVRGYLAAGSDDERAKQLMDGDKIDIVCYDVFQGQWITEMTLGAQKGEGLLYFPGMESRPGK